MARIATTDAAFARYPALPRAVSSDRGAALGKERRLVALVWLQSLLCLFLGAAIAVAGAVLVQAALLVLTIAAPIAASVLIWPAARAE